MKLARTIFANLLLVIISLSLFDLLFEWAFLKYYLYQLPINYHYILPRPYRSLALHSKKEVTPKDDYVLLLGDSYAQGLGDWFLQTDVTKNEPFGSADILFQQSGRDVLNFGKSGFSPVSALSLAPRAKYAYLNSSFFLNIKKPKYVVFYFYEGNDLTDNIKVLHELSLEKEVTVEELASLKTYQNTIVDRILLRNSYYIKGKFLPFMPQYISLNMVNALLKSLVNGEQAASAHNPATSGTINKILVGGEEIAIPDDLQGPALELSTEEMGKSLAMVGAAFRDLKEQFPDSKIFIIYLPSPLTTYEMAGDSVSTQSYFSRETIYPVPYLMERAAFIENQIQNFAEETGFAFYNIKAELRAADTVLHGLSDWKHYNREGYTILGTKIAELINTSNPAAPIRHDTTSRKKE